MGAGVQSSCLAFMISRGEYKPKFDNIHFIFADTGWEPHQVYSWLDNLEEYVNYPVHRVQRIPTKSCSGDLRKDMIKTGGTVGRIGSPPLHVMRKGKKGMLQRRCTKEYKIRPVEAKIRELLGYAKNKRVKQEWNDTSPPEVDNMLGISYDEMQRMSDSRLKYITNSFPLVDLKMTRQDCLEWMLDNGFPEPMRSACVGCPYRSTKDWLEMKKDPENWKDALEVDKAIRGGFMATKGAEYFLHRSCKSLEEVEFEKLNKKHEISFLDECSGLCGN